MSEEVERAFQALRLEYLASLPDRLEELRSDVARLRGGDSEARASLKVRLHRLAGSGGSYGFVGLSAIAREGERRLSSPDGALEVDRLEEIINQLARAALEAQSELRKGERQE